MNPTVTAFEGPQRIASGPLSAVARRVRELLEAGFPVLVFDDATGRVVDLDLREAPEPPPQRGRPRLGVTAREVTLLPRHWDFLATQGGGASVALRRIIDEAMTSPAALRRAAQEAAYRFMTALGGNLPGYEEATRALFAADEGRFTQHTQTWPADIRDYARTLAGPAFG